MKKGSDVDFRPGGLEPGVSGGTVDGKAPPAFGEYPLWRVNPSPASRYRTVTGEFGFPSDKTNDPNGPGDSPLIGGNHPEPK